MNRRKFVQTLSLGAGLIVLGPLRALRAAAGGGLGQGGTAVGALPPEAGKTLLASGQVLAPGVATRGADAPAPEWLFAPLTDGRELAPGVTLAAVSPVAYGGFSLVLATATGAARVTCCKLDAGSPMGIAQGGGLDFLLANAGRGEARTDEAVGVAIHALAAAAAAHGAGRVDGLPLMTFSERTARFGPGVIL